MNTKTYVNDIADEWDKLLHLINSSEKKKDFNDWDSMFIYSMYQVLTEYALEQNKIGENFINIDNIPIERFEQKFLENLQYEGNEKYLKQYKGFRNKKYKKRL